MRQLVETWLRTALSRLPDQKVINGWRSIPPPTWPRTGAGPTTYGRRRRRPGTAPAFWRDAGCHDEAAVLRVGGSCVVSATGRQFVALASKAPDEERLMAVTVVAPVAGNVHRPLRTGYADDRRSSCQRQALQRGTCLLEAIDAEAFAGYHPNLASGA